MNLVFVFFSYIWWLYSEGWKEFFRAWGNFHWFLFHFFSIGILFQTLFAPWHRLQEKKTRGFDPEKFFERVVINIILRLVGFVIRTAFIVIGLISEILLFILGSFLFLLFILSPIAIPAMFFWGILFFFM